MPRNKLSVFERAARESISANLKNCMHGMTQAELSKKTGIPITTLSGYIRKKSTPNAETLEKLASALNVKISDIDPRYEISNSIDISGMYYARIPIIGTTTYGETMLTEHNIEGYTYELLEEKTGTAELFALRCKGDSMEPLIPDGALVLIHKQSTVEDDKIAAIRADDTRVILRKIKHVGKNVILYSINSKYAPTVLNEDNLDCILGKAIHVRFDI